MRATEFEFRNRWWVIFAIFFAAFGAYNIDHVSSAQAIVGWVARRAGITAADNDLRILFAVGALFLVLAAFLRTWGTSYLRSEVMRDRQVHTERLLADGPYRYVRNPLYLGNIFMAMGIGLMASRTGFVILVLGMTIFVIRLLLREEAELARDQGEPYRNYCAAVPRLVPAISPQVPPAGDVPRWAQGIRAELMYWIMALAMAVFAVTLNIRLFWGLFAVAMATAFLYKRPAPKVHPPPAAS
ncbi:MAG TPA: isoprenylcysteine carboxylmethyltransferase family protein [Candidatus Acidoferrales bacterium]|nr:isoprenylcysteine carboxylmethyltransferase family protein [Candidatus Acidoferrales bacterium]